MSRICFVFNPTAGKGSGRKLRARILEALTSRLPDFEFVETTRRGEATELTRMSACPVVVAIGGDGTVHEVANGLIGSDKVLGVLPIGSGNDFVKSIGIPADLDASISALVSHIVERIDVGLTRIIQRNGEVAAQDSGSAYFVNGVGIGFDAAVAIRTQRISIVSGTLVYVLAVLQTLGRYVAPEFEVCVDRRTTRSRNLLVAIGNGTCAGGGFYLTPEAKVDDGQLDVCIVEEMSIPGILRLMPLVMRGKHEGASSVKFDRGGTINVRADHPTAVHADGEILGDDISAIEIEVVPRSLRVIVGPSFRRSETK